MRKIIKDYIFPWSSKKWLCATRQKLAVSEQFPRKVGMVCRGIMSDTVHLKR